MGSIKRMLEEKIPGIYVRSLMIGDSIIEVGCSLNTVFLLCTIRGESNIG